MVVALDEPRPDPRDLRCGKASEQIPPEVKRLLDRASLDALPDEPSLEVVDESERAAVVIRERIARQTGRASPRSR
jgi:hypothetical protein